MHLIAPQPYGQQCLACLWAWTPGSVSWLQVLGVWSDRTTDVRNEFWFPIKGKRRVNVNTGVLTTCLRPRLAICHVFHPHHEKNASDYKHLVCSKMMQSFGMLICLPKLFLRRLLSGRVAYYFVSVIDWPWCMCSLFCCCFYLKSFSEYY